MERLIKNNICSDILYVDNNYTANRISKIEITTDWTEDHYSIWRKHLLEQKSNKFILREKGDRRDEYLRKRYQLLESKYKKTTTTTTTTTTLSPRRQNTTTTSNTNTNTTPTNSNNMNEIIKNLNYLEDFSFSGMHHIFDEHKKSINRIKFGKDSKDLIGFASSDGTLTISKLLPKVEVIGTLKGHTNSIIDFEWCNSNQEIITASLDGTIKLWLLNNNNISLLKTFGKELSIGVILSICVHPIKTNLLFISEDKSIIKIIDITTGKIMSKIKVQSPITCMQFEEKGYYLFLGDEKGMILIFKFNQEGGAFLSMVSKTQVSNTQSSITSIQVHYWYSSSNKPPVLSIVCNSKDSKMRVFIVKSISTGNFVLFREINVQCSRLLIRSIFSPVFKNREGAFLVTGSEDSTIYIYDINKKDKLCVNQLMGHSTPVLDVAWNSDESLLATADNSGTVIIWNRKKINK